MRFSFFKKDFFCDIWKPTYLIDYWLWFTWLFICLILFHHFFYSLPILTDFLKFWHPLPPPFTPFILKSSPLLPLEYQIDKFLSPKGLTKSSPHFQLLQNPKVQFKHYLSCKLCYCSSFICMTSSKLWPTSYKVDPLLFTGRSIHLRLVPSTL